MKKYELTNEQIIHQGHILYRIRALRDIPAVGVRAGDLGGFVEGEHNLSHEGDAWISEDAKVWESAQVYHDAHVCGRAEVCGKTHVYNFAKVFGDAFVSDALIFEHAQVFGKAVVMSGLFFGEVQVGGNACIADEHVVLNRDAVVTVTPIVIVGLEYSGLLVVILSDKHMCIGNEQHTYDRWKNWSLKDTREQGVHENACTLWKEHRSVLLQLMKSHTAKVKAATS